MDENLIRVIGKNKKERIVPFGDIAKNVLNDYINNYRTSINKKNSTYIFLNNLLFAVYFIVGIFYTCFFV